VQKKLIIKPGYHLRPKYDLHELRERRNTNHKANVVADLPLTSMIDMFTVLVIFLLMNFSATGEVFYIQKNLKIPQANYGKPLQSAPLITITASSVILETEKVGDNPIYLEEKDQNLPKLANALKQIRIIEETIHPGQPFSGSVNIQADESTPLVYIKRVMQTCISEGWVGINFAVNADGAGSPLTPESTN